MRFKNRLVIIPTTDTVCIVNCATICNAEILAGRNDVYRCSGRCFVQTQPTITYYLQPLELSEYDRQQMKSDSRHVPKPKLHDYSYSFDIPIDSELRHVQLLANKKCLLVLSDCNQSLSVYMDSLDNLKGAVENDRHKKHFHKDKLGGTAVLAFDESKRMLVICVVDAHKVCTTLSLLHHAPIFDSPALCAHSLVCLR